jgi:hypothetical protein
VKVAVYVNQTTRGGTSQIMEAIARGIAECGDDVEKFQRTPPNGMDAIVVWGERKRVRLFCEGFKQPILVAERAYLGDRFSWTSLGWDGLNGHARFNEVFESDRFDRHFASDLKPWRDNSKGYALIMGQVMGDMSLANVDIVQWYKDTATELWKAGWDIRFRPHPESDRKGHERPRVPFAKIAEGSLDDALSGAGLVAAWNSNSLLDAVMAGVPIYAGDCGSMVYGLASRDFNPVRPHREKRLNEIANVQWTMDELANGSAWGVVKAAM